MPPPNTCPDTVQLQAIQRHFLARALEDVGELRQLQREPGSEPAMARILHALKGSAGSCGFHEITSAAAALDRELTGEAVVLDQLLEELAQSVEAGHARLANENEADSTARSDGRSSTGSTGSTDDRASGKVTVLCVEDDDDIALLVRCALESDRRSVEVSSDGRRGWERLESGPRPDVVLLDLMLPEINGFELLERIRSSPELQDLPVLVLSARAGDARERAIAAGADACLPKPFDINDLNALVEDLVR